MSIMLRGSVGVNLLCSGYWNRVQAVAKKNYGNKYYLFRVCLSITVRPAGTEGFIGLMLIKFLVWKHYYHTIKSLLYVRATGIYLESIGYMFRPVNRSSSGHQSNKLSSCTDRCSQLDQLSILERASRSALTQYTINSLVYVSTTGIYLEYIGYMFRPVNRSSSGHQSNKNTTSICLHTPSLIKVKKKR